MCFIQIGHHSFISHNAVQKFVLYDLVSYCLRFKEVLVILRIIRFPMYTHSNIMESPLRNNISFQFMLYVMFMLILRFQWWPKRFFIQCDSVMVLVCTSWQGCELIMQFLWSICVQSNDEYYHDIFIVVCCIQYTLRQKDIIWNIVLLCFVLFFLATILQKTFSNALS